jgi:hypothetical protein
VRSSPADHGGGPGGAHSPLRRAAIKPREDLHRAAGELARSTGVCAMAAPARRPPSRRATAPTILPVRRALTGPTGGRVGQGRAEREAQRANLCFCSFPSTKPRQRARFPAVGRPFGTASCETTLEATREAVPKAP